MSRSTSWRNWTPPGERILAPKKPQLPKTVPTFTKAQQTTELLLFQLRAAQLPLPVCEYRFAPPRRWRFDLCWVEQKLAVELEGLVFPPAPTWDEKVEHRLGGRHVSVTGYLNDISKQAEAFALGYTLLHLTHRMIENGEALQFIERRLRRIAEG